MKDNGQGIERVPMTPEGKVALEKRLKEMVSVERPKVIKAIEEARAHGDLSENAEYDAAKEQQGKLEAHIADYESRLARAEVIHPPKEVPDRVIFGISVTAVDVDNEQEVTYRIVGEHESDPSNKLISVTSPIARAFIGKEIGEEVTVRTPGGPRTYEITDINL